MRSNQLFPGKLYTFILALLLAVSATTQRTMAASCYGCHPSEVSGWRTSTHANTMTNVSWGLSHDFIGKTPAEVLQGPDGQSCIACHAPTAVLTNGGMTEIEALGFYFTTTEGQFTSGTSATNASRWPHLDCTGCHYVPPQHTINPAYVALFESSSKSYRFLGGNSQICGYCHGDLRFPNTDRRLYNGWTNSAHRLSQQTLAEGLRTAHAGKTPEQVLADENCIACHAPRAALSANGSEAQALSTFFTTTNGVFNSETAAMQTGAWPGVDCTTCHDKHAPGGLSLFNSSTLTYDRMADAEQLCGQCHGTLRFSNSKYRSYDVVKQIGGINVTNQQVMAGVTCQDCHMYASAQPGSNSKQFHGHSWAITVTETNGVTTTSCTACHPSISTYVANAIIGAWKTEFQAAAAMAQTNVANALAALGGSSDPAIQAALAEAQQNLSLALADESGGVHNHTFTMALVKAANDKVLGLPLPTPAVLAASKEGSNVVISWTGDGTLQQAEETSGEWKDLTNAPNPLLVAPEQMAPKSFFRLRR